jgi:hypothetical protein
MTPGFTGLAGPTSAAAIVVHYAKAEICQILKTRLEGLT